MATPEKDPLPRLKAIGAQIKRIREKRGMTQTELAAAAGIAHPNTLGDYERGEGGGFSILTAVAIADALEVPMDQLLGRRGAPETVPLARERAMHFTTRSIVEAIKKAKKSGKWDAVREHFGLGFGFGFVLTPEATSVPEDQYQADLAAVLEATKEVGYERLLKWCKEDLDDAHPGSGGFKTERS